MKDAAIIFSAIGAGIALIGVVIAILPFLIAAACIVLMWWMIAMFITGGFGPWPWQWK